LENLLRNAISKNFFLEKMDLFSKLFFVKKCKTGKGLLSLVQICVNVFCGHKIIFSEIILDDL
jgi:hypothetical protein